MTSLAALNLTDCIGYGFDGRTQRKFYYALSSENKDLLTDRRAQSNMKCKMI